MDSTQDGVEQIHAAEQAARARIEDAEKRARTMREEADKESRSILKKAEVNAGTKATRLLDGVSKDSSKIELEIQGDAEARIEDLIAAAEKKKKGAIVAALKMMLEE